MDNNDRNARYVVGVSPVNRRTANAQLPQSESAPAHVLQRAQQLRRRHELGAPLGDLMKGAELGAVRSPVPGGAVASLVAGTALLPLAALSGSLLSGAVLGAGSIVLLGFAGWRIAGSRRRHASTSSKAAPLVDVQSVAALDEVLDEVAPELDDALLQQLMQVKHTLTRVLELERSTDDSSPFASENRLYLQQCVKRYLPDTLLAYLKVPSTHRHQAPPQGGSSAAQALMSQLALIQQTLERHEALGVAAACEPLMRQERFLQAKTRHPR